MPDVRIVRVPVVLAILAALVNIGAWIGGADYPTDIMKTLSMLFSQLWLMDVFVTQIYKTGRNNRDGGTQPEDPEVVRKRRDALRKRLAM